MIFFNYDTLPVNIFKVQRRDLCLQFKNQYRKLVFLLEMIEIEYKHYCIMVSYFHDKHKTILIDILKENLGSIYNESKIKIVQSLQDQLFLRDIDDMFNSIQKVSYRYNGTLFSHRVCIFKKTFSYEISYSLEERIYIVQNACLAIDAQSSGKWENYFSLKTESSSRGWTLSSLPFFYLLFTGWYGGVEISRERVRSYYLPFTG